MSQLCAELIITTRKNGTAVAALVEEDGRPLELTVFTDDTASDVGAIYVGRVHSVAKNIQAAFVELKNGETAYLPLADAREGIYTKKGPCKTAAVGDELLVQVTGDAVKTKKASVTASRLSLSGKYLVLTLKDKRISCSGKLPPAEKERLKRTAAAMVGENPEFGLILRTNAAQASEPALKEEFVRLKTELERILQTAPYRPCFSCLRPALKPYLYVIQNTYTEGLSRIVTDRQDWYADILAFLQLTDPELARITELYQDRLLPLAALHSLDQELERALSPRVWLKSGAYLVIEPTEALTVIDVNTGKYEGGKDRRKTFLKINREAAAEIARQLRLRSIYGIIIVDFINMEEEEDRRLLLEEFSRLLSRDPVKTVLVEMTRLNLVEITRKKGKKSLAEQCRAVETEKQKKTDSY